MMAVAKSTENGSPKVQPEKRNNVAADTGQKIQDTPTAKDTDNASATKVTPMKKKKRRKRSKSPLGAGANGKLKCDKCGQLLPGANNYQGGQELNSRKWASDRKAFQRKAAKHAKLASLAIDQAQTDAQTKRKSDAKYRAELAEQKAEKKRQADETAKIKEIEQAKEKKLITKKQADDNVKSIMAKQTRRKQRRKARRAKELADKKAEEGRHAELALAIKKRDAARKKRLDTFVQGLDAALENDNNPNQYEDLGAALELVLKHPMVDEDTLAMAPPMGNPELAKKDRCGATYSQGAGANVLIEAGHCNVEPKDNCGGKCNTPL